MTKIAIIGECMVEISGTPFSNHLMQGYGGDTLNTAVYLSRLLNNHDVFYVTGLGADCISDQLCKQWQEENINTEFVLRFNSLFPGLYWIILDETGERSFLYWRKNSAASQWLKHHEIEKTLNKIFEMDWVYLSGISLAILDDNDREKLLNWLKKYHDKGGKIAFDSNYRTLLWHDQLKAQTAYREILSITNIALLTNDDEKSVWNLDDKALFQHYKNFNIPIIIFKQDKNGALIIQPQQEDILVPALKVEKVVDSTAAGDSFNAGFIASFIQGGSLSDACHNGHKLASTVIQYKGAIIAQTAMPEIF